MQGSRPACLLLACGFLCASQRAAAHPAGIGSVNRSLSVDRLRDGSVRLAYQLDLAELPAYVELEKLDADHDGRVVPAEREAYFAVVLPALIRALRVSVDGHAMPLRVTARGLEVPQGQGGLSTLRILLSLAVDRRFDPDRDVVVRLRDGSYADKPGYREMSASASAACLVVASSLPRTAASLAYRTDPSARPPRIDDATFTLRVRGSAADRWHPSAAFAGWLVAAVSVLGYLWRILVVRSRQRSA